MIHSRDMWYDKKTVTLTRHHTNKFMLIANKKSAIIPLYQTSAESKLCSLTFYLNNLKKRHVLNKHVQDTQIIKYSNYLVVLLSFEVHLSLSAAGKGGW